MNKFFYPKLALTNIKNNYKTYLPYILACIGTVMMYYIIFALATDIGLKSMYGGMQTQVLLMLGTYVIAIFAIIFLLYTNSFLIKRRKKEFGLFNILGMEKKHISKIMIFETLYVAIISLACGILFGILFSKLVQLLLLKILKFNVQFGLAISIKSIISTLVLFTIIFVIALLKNLQQIHLSKPIELLRGGQTGEKEPKTKWLLSIIGFLALGSGYYLAIATKDPISAMGVFFIAVILVIIGTYCLFTAGSIAILKMLRKNKSYYYKTKNFISVSGMIYRMKQNAAGLANICILSTMVLVMLSSTISLYIGADEIIRNRFPRDIVISVYDIDDENNVKAVNEAADKALAKHNIQRENNLDYTCTVFSALQEKNTLELKEKENFDISSIRVLCFVALDEYNQMTSNSYELDDNEILISSNREKFKYDTLNIFSKTYNVKDNAVEKISNGAAESNVASTYYIIVKDRAELEEIVKLQNEVNNETGGKQLVQFIGFDMDASVEESIEAYKDISHEIGEIANCNIDIESSDNERDTFFALYGGLLFLGIFLGILFIMATVLIMYYKQISEGYDDKGRFEIMQNVGMSHEEVKKAIHSQIIMVFFLPLLTAIMHICFAFSIIAKLLAIINLTNVSLFAICTVVSILVFAVFYAIVYNITARAYYKIVK